MWYEIWMLNTFPKYIHKEVPISFSIIVTMSMIISFLWKEELKLLLSQMPSYFSSFLGFCFPHCFIFSKVLGNKSALGLNLSSFGKVVLKLMAHMELLRVVSSLLLSQYCVHWLPTSFGSFIQDLFLKAVQTRGWQGHQKAHPCTKSSGGRTVLETDPCESWNLWKESDKNRKFTQTQPHLWG